MISIGATDHAVREAVCAFGRHLIGDAPPPPSFAGPNIDRDTEYARFWAEEQICILQRAVSNGDFKSFEVDVADPLIDTRRHAASLAFALGLPATGDNPHFVMLQSGVARAQIEERRRYLARLSDPFADPALADSLFTGTRTGLAPSNGAASEMTMSAAISIYLNAKSGVAWTSRTEADNARLLQLAAEHFGSDTPLSSIRKEHVRAFRDSLLTWRRKPPAGCALSEISGAPPGHRIGPKTAAKYFGYVTAAFSFWVGEGLLDVSPIGKITVQLPAGSMTSARDTFTEGEISAFFSSPIFAGCAGPLRRISPGPIIIKDGLYWALLIAPLSGMRITEIVQLAEDDVNFDETVPNFRIRGDLSRDQRVKTDAGWRRVPVHHRLIDLGFEQFVRERQKEPTGRLFHDIHVSATGGRGGEFSKLFGRLMTRLKLKRHGLVFHSFRHTFIDQLREHGAPEYVIKRIVGHAAKSITDGYGAGASLKACQGWLNKVNLLENLPPDRKP
jgi:integrase